jgi:hypothetical protein
MPQRKSQKSKSHESPEKFQNTLGTSNGTDTSAIDPYTPKAIPMRLNGRTWEISLDLDAYFDALVEGAEKGDEEALNRLWIVASHAIANLKSLSAKNPELVRSVAKTVSWWPVMHGLLPIFQKENEKFFKKICLSRDPKDSEFGEMFRYRWNDAKNKSFDILCWISFIKETGCLYAKHRCPEHLAHSISKLGEYSIDSWGEWFKIAKQLIMHVTDGHPEGTFFLRGLGQSRGTHHGHAAGSKTSEANIRDGIFVKIKGACFSLTKYRPLCRAINMNLGRTDSFESFVEEIRYQIPPILKTRPDIFKRMTSSIHKKV